MPKLTATELDATATVLVVGELDSLIFCLVAISFKKLTTLPDALSDAAAASAGRPMFAVTNFNKLFREKLPLVLVAAASDKAPMLLIND